MAQVLLDYQTCSKFALALGKGMDPMLLLWGVQDRCTAAIASEISKLVAMLGSSQEVEQVLSDRGQPLNFKTIRTIAYRFATRARAAQRVGNLNWGVADHLRGG